MRLYGAFFVLLIGILSACATSSKTPLPDFTRGEEKVVGFTKHFKESAFAIGASGLYSVEVLLIKGTLMVGQNDFDIIIHDARDADVAGAELTITARYVDNGIETSPAKVTPNARLHGLYTAANLDIPRPGHWEMTVEVRMDGQAEIVTFDFPDVR